MSAARTCLVTGAAAGIGRAIAEAFGRDPATHLVLLDRDGDRLAEWLAASPPACSVETHTLDITDRAALEAMFAGLRARGASLDVLVNSAGICDENEPEDIDTFRRVIEVNLHGSHLVTALGLGLMPGPGRILQLSSILGRAGKVRNSGYCASKHAIVGMTKALALDLAPLKITVNAILPAWVDTPMLRGELARQAAMSGQDEAAIQRTAKRQLPLKRFIDPAEIAALACFLASPEAAGITAQALVVDGGAALGM